MSKIEWTDKTWNPVAGCSLVSPGCTNCYAMRMAARLEAMGQKKYAGTTKRVNGHVVWTGKLNLDEDALTIPLRTKKPTMWFVNSMSDLFHEDVPFDFIDTVFAVMALTPQHTFQVLTKRPGRMAEYFLGRNLAERWHRNAFQITGRTDQEIDPYLDTLPLPNVWLGTSAEDQTRLNERLPHLRRCPAAVHFLSLEPLLGGINFADRPGIQWVIVGGESGPGARPMNVGWVRSIIGQCKAAGVACFVKQLGAKPIFPEPPACPDCNGTGREEIPCDPDEEDCEFCSGTGTLDGELQILRLKSPKGGDMAEWPADLCVREFPQQLTGQSPKEK